MNKLLMATITEQTLREQLYRERNFFIQAQLREALKTAREIIRHEQDAINRERARAVRHDPGIPSACYTGRSVFGVKPSKGGKR